MHFVSGGQTESIEIQLQLGRCSGKRGKVKGKDVIKLEEKYEYFNNIRQNQRWDPKVRWSAP